VRRQLFQHQRRARLQRPCRRFCIRCRTRISGHAAEWKILRWRSGSCASLDLAPFELRTALVSQGRLVRSAQSWDTIFRRTIG
jgi:hypothetical protein